jgi:RimJ/RimL family protein N-acetyltransferase
VRLETERLLLRPFVADDLDALALFYADPEVMRYMGSGGTLDRTATHGSLERMIAGLEAQGFGQLAVVRKEDGAVLGRCGILVWDEQWRPIALSDARGPVQFEIGYLLGREFWGHGYATEAATEVRDWALANLAPPRLICLIHSDNERSAKVARKLAMVPAGEEELFGGRVVVYALEKPPAR